jgi:predicted PurR-regulated permease PerM
MWTVGFAIYIVIAGLADNVLKPLMLGRGFDVPMPVVPIGALGGMITGGVIGLFIGPVALPVGYRLFWLWVEDQSQTRSDRTMSGTSMSALSALTTRYIVKMSAKGMGRCGQDDWTV